MSKQQADDQPALFWCHGDLPVSLDLVLLPWVVADQVLPVGTELPCQMSDNCVESEVNPRRGSAPHNIFKHNVNGSIHSQTDQPHF